MTRQRNVVWPLLAGMAVLGLAGPAQAQVVVKHCGANDPTTEGFTRGGVNGAGTLIDAPLNVDEGFGLATWRIHDPHAVPQPPPASARFYQYNLTPAEVANLDTRQAMQSQQRLAKCARETPI